MNERLASANEQVQRLTGRSIEAWTRDARRYVQQHPLESIALTIGLGCVLGKILSRD